ncbi:MAG: S49 family peptidase, partial [Burkholderiaceae bacterium]
MSDRRPDDIPASPDKAAGPVPTEASVETTAVLAGLVAALEASTREQRRARRWRVFFRFLFVGIFLWIAVVAHRYGLPDAGEAGERHTAVVELRGVIDGRGDASSARVSQALRAAFEHPGTAAVLLRINSPGGSPVQAGIIHDEIRRLRKLHSKVPIYAVVEDICASGGYYVAVAADRIYVDKASLVGSIGVLMEGFGFAGLIEKLGIERRLLTAGANKGFLDSFSPLTPAHRAHTQTLLNQIHAQFVDA